MTTDSYKEQATGRESTDLTTLMDRNRTFVNQFGAGDLTIRPRMSTIILTCVDARVDPAHIFELGLGNFLVTGSRRQGLPDERCRARRISRSNKNSA